MQRFVQLLLPLLAAASVTTAHAQRISTVPFGSRIRIETCLGAPIVGAFGGVRSDSIQVVIDSVVTSTTSFQPDRIVVARAIAVDCAWTYSVFERYGNRAGRGALVGAGVGLALIGAALAGDLAYERRGGAAQLPATAFAVPVALILTGIGALIGSASGPEQWSPPQATAAALRWLPQANLAQVVNEKSGARGWLPNPSCCSQTDRPL